MGFRFRKPDLDKYKEYIIAKTHRIVFSAFEAVDYACLQAVAKAKSLDTYKDRTGNLRSSIGYVIYLNGECLRENFEGNFGSPGTAEDGKGTGKAFAHQLAKNNKSKGIVAVIVAGMNYALFVESNGYDVISGPTLNLAEDLQDAFNEINKKYKMNLRIKR